MTGEGGMQVLESRFSLNDQRVWFGKAKLLADRIVLKGLGYHRRIDLKDIVEVRWAASELIIVLEDGDEIDMTIKAAALWKYELQARCGLKDAGTGGSASGGLPGVLPRGLGEDRAKAREDTSDFPGSREDDISGHRASAEASSPYDSDPEERGEEALSEEDRAAGEQTEMFLQRESTYRVRNGFAEDRPQQPKRAEDPAED